MADAKNRNQETAAAAISEGNHVEFLLCARDKAGCMAVGTTTNQIFPAKCHLQQPRSADCVGHDEGCGTCA